MKSFHQLTVDQQENAIAFASVELAQAIDCGLIEVRNTSPDTIRSLAIDVAEGSKYDDNGKPIVDDVIVPYYYQGGCV